MRRTTKKKTTKPYGVRKAAKKVKGKTGRKLTQTVRTILIIEGRNPRKPVTVRTVSTKQTGRKNRAKAKVARDKKRVAMPPGKRKVRGGGTYYEYRDNRTDKLGKTS